MKICRITSAFPPPWHGLAPGPYELSLAQSKMGHRITVITKYSKGSESVDQKVPFRVHRIRGKRHSLFNLLSVGQFILLHSKDPFDIVHSHGDSGLGVLLLSRLLFRKIPVVSSVHIVRKAQYKAIKKFDIYKEVREILGKEESDGLLDLKKDRWELLKEKLYLKFSNALAVVSASLKDEIEREYGRFNQVFVIFNGVNLSFFNGDGFVKDRGISNGRYTILFVGVLNGRKGEFLLIRAMEKVLSEYPKVKLLIVGDGPTRSLAEELVRRMGLSDHVQFIVNLPYQEMTKCYAESDIFVLPSYSEGLPKVLLEAMASGTPVIASDIPPHKEIIKENVTGYLFKTGDVNSLASTILSALKNVKQRISDNARALIQKEYSWRAVVERIDRVYESLESS